MRRLRLLLLSFLLLLLTAAANAQTLRKQYPDAAPFADIVWKVRSSKQVQVGMIYVFLSDGTLAMTSRNSKPAFGEWMFKKGVFTMVEEGRPYKVTILKRTPTEFRVKISNPGEPIIMTLVAAKR